MPGNGHVRFGGRAEETDRWKRRHRAWSDPTAGGCSPRARKRRSKGAAGPVKWWLWVFLGPNRLFVMDTRSGAVLARHAGIDRTTGQLVEHPATGSGRGRRGRGGWSSPATSTASTPRPAARLPGW